MTSLRKIASNQKNSRKSTGPKTKEGKEKLCRNALKHGLAGEGLILPDEEMAAVLQREAEWNSSLRPFNPFEIWLAQRIATESVRIDVCTLQSALLRTRTARCALDCWDDDRRAAAEALTLNLRGPNSSPDGSGSDPGLRLADRRWGRWGRCSTVRELGRLETRPRLEPARRPRRLPRRPDRSTRRPRSRSRRISGRSSRPRWPI